MARINTISAVSSLFCFLFSILSFQISSYASNEFRFNIMTVHCDPDEFNKTSSYGSNRDTVISNLRKSSSLGTYSNFTSGLSPNTVYGMFLCRGDINRTFCSDCVKTAFDYVESCTFGKEAYVFFEECMVRYTDYPFFTLVEDIPNVAALSPFRTQLYNHTLLGKLDELIIRASSSSPFPYFVEHQERVTQLIDSYDLETIVQCSPGLSPSNCTICLRLMVQNLFECCSHHQASSAQIVSFNCLVKYNIIPLQPTLGVTNGNQKNSGTFAAIMTASVLALMGFQ